jgi:hypothetical protein
MKLIWSVICNRIITDQKTNTVSYIDCIEEVQTPNFPAIMANCSIGTLWKKEAAGEENLKARVYIDYPSGKSEQLIETEIIQVLKPHHRLSFQLDGFPLKEEGLHLFRIELSISDKWKPISEVGFTVKSK